MLRSYATLIRRERSILLFGVACACLSGPGQTYFIALFIGAFTADFNLGATQLGSLYLAATLGAACLLPVVGSWARGSPSAKTRMILADPDTC
jgi:hypothetical protein